jgi:hypothetical protein
MKSLHRLFNGIIYGLVIGILSCSLLLYILHMEGMLIVSMPSMPHVQIFLKWVFENLRLSIIPFSIILVLYFHNLIRLKNLLKKGHATLVEISQKEHFIDIWINLFFGMGVIWTAIGMRSALINGLGGLEISNAAKLGAFAILERLVNGGILMALSTTIFGGVGGYVLKLVKAAVVGYEIKNYYYHFSNAQSDRVINTLNHIENQISAFAMGDHGKKEVEQ